MMDIHAAFMERCYELGRIAAAMGESPVGSLLVKNGQIIGEGYEQSRQLKDITRHAEVVAILDALQRDPDLSGAVLYSNVEPCILCAYMIRHHKLSEVVFARHSGELGGSNPDFNLLGHPFASWVEPPVITHYTGS